MKKYIFIVAISFMTGISACKHQETVADWQSDDISGYLSGPQPDIKVAVMGYYWPTTKQHTYTILEKYYKNKDCKISYSLQTKSNLYIDNTLITWPQASEEGFKFVESLFKKPNFNIEGRNMKTIGLKDFNEEIESLEAITSFKIVNDRKFRSGEDIPIKWNKSMKAGEKCMVTASFSNIWPSSKGESFTWNKITDDDGEFTIPSKALEKIIEGHVDLTLYRVQNKLKVIDGQRVQLSCIYQGKYGFSINVK